MALYGKTTLKAIQDGIDCQKAFNAGNVRGTMCKAYDFGRLPQEYVDQYKSDNVLYTIYSYQTPIAWYNGKEWVIPDVKYSSSTTGHQGRIRVAVHNPGFWNKS